MSKGKLSILMMAASLSLSCPQARGQEGMDQFIDELMAKMTVEEKIGQLHLMAAGDITTGNAVSSPLGEDIAGGRLGGVFNVKGVEKIRALQDIAVRRSRLGIPLIVGMDVIHGYETVFPIPLALAASWDMEAIERSARVAARECSADGICWTFSPMVDVAVDQRWGRVAEGSGEDPFLGSRVAEAMVRGYQGQEPYAGNDRVMACVKHFALYGASEGGKEYNTVDMSRLRMYNQYFPPYKAAVEAGAGSVMSSFNLVEGIHATANRWLLTDVLRGEWGFLAAHRRAPRRVGLRGLRGHRLWLHRGVPRPWSRRPLPGLRPVAPGGHRHGHVLPRLPHHPGPEPGGGQGLHRGHRPRLPPGARGQV